MALRLMKHAVDPREQIRKDIGDVANIEVFNDMVLVAVYERPEMTASGIVIPDQTREEDKHQGKAALVLKIGPLVNLGDKQARGGELAVGDWVAIRPSDGWNVTLNGKLCRLVSEKGINLRIPSPDSVW